MLNASEITVAFAETTVLDAVSLEVADGEIVALLGPSGSGKSTMLRVIAGLLTPQSGSVHIDGTDVTDWPTHRRGVGLIFQDEQLFPHRNVADNIGFGLEMTGVKRAERTAQVAELLAIVGLSGFEHRAVTGLSGGEAKRVAVARALAPRPRVLLLDEPLTGLDRELHDRLIIEVPQIIRAAATTAVWVTHDRHEAAEVADCVVELDAPIAFRRDRSQL